MFLGIYYVHIDMNAIDIDLSLLLTTQRGQKSTGVKIIVKLNHVYSRGRYFIRKFETQGISHNLEFYYGRVYAEIFIK